MLREDVRRYGSRTVLVSAIATLILSGQVACSSSDASPGSEDWPAGAAMAVPAAVGTDQLASASQGSPRVHLTQIASGHGRPTSIAATPDGKELLVALQDGRIGRISMRRSGRFMVPEPSAETVLDLSSRTVADAERGLLSIGVTPDGRTLVTYHTTVDGAIAVDVYPYMRGRAVDPDSGRTVMEIDHPFTHNGGGMAITASGDMLLGIGALEVTDGAEHTVQDPDGLVVRIPNRYLESAGSGLFVPTSADVVARGLRNPWRLSLDRATGELWIGDVGESATEEVDVVPAPQSSADAPNFGWPYFEASLPYLVDPPAGLQFSPPRIVYGHDDGSCAVVGGYVYRGEAIPALVGSYIFGDFCSTGLRRLGAQADGSELSDLVDGDDSIVTLGEGVDGELYVAGTQGGIYRIDPASARAPDLGTAIATSGSPTPSPAPSSTSDPAPCRIAVAFRRIGQSMAATGDLRAAVQDAQAVISENVDGIPPQTVEAVEYLRTVIAAFAVVAERNLWSPEAPEVRRFMGEVAAERGQYSRTLYSEYQLENSSGPNCGS